MKKRFSELCRSQKNRRLKVLKENFDRSNSANNILNIDDNSRFVESEPIDFGSFEPKVIKLRSSVAFAISECEFNIQKNECDINLREKLANWAILFDISQEAINNLLFILKEGLNLPLNVRTLLSTPVQTNIVSLHPWGSYFHYGLENSLKDQLRVLGTLFSGTNISFNINIDGLPLSKSSKSQFWPILGEIVPKIGEPFVIGVYHGHKKPASTEFVDIFINEYNQLRKYGFMYINHKYSVSINAIICDSPARSFVTATKGHNGYNGCSKCTDEGEYRNYKMLFLKLDAPLRTDESFKQRLDENHHTGFSPFLRTEVAMVTQFPLDYMHLACLGVMKKMINLWMYGHYNVRLSAAKMNQLSRDLIALREWIPVEFQRKPRGVDEVDRWKATEFRLFLLYLGIILVDKYLPQSYAIHFYALNCALRILNRPEDCIRNNVFAKELLIYFVDGKDLYGEDTIIFNIHNLIHLPSDVLKFGPIDSFIIFRNKEAYFITEK